LAFLGGKGGGHLWRILIDDFSFFVSMNEDMGWAYDDGCFFGGEGVGELGLMSNVDALVVDVACWCRGYFRWWMD